MPTLFRKSLTSIKISKMGSQFAGEARKPILADKFHKPVDFISRAFTKARG